MLLLLESFDSFLELEEPEEPPKREVAACCRPHGCTAARERQERLPSGQWHEMGPPRGAPEIHQYWAEIGLRSD